MRIIKLRRALASAAILSALFVVVSSGVLMISAVRGAERKRSGIVEKPNFGEQDPEIVRTLVTQFGAQYCSAKVQWVPGRWNGIVIGKTTPKEAEARLENFSVKPCPGEQNKINGVLESSKVRSFAGKVTVSYRCDRPQTVEFIFQEPAKPWSLEESFRKFGKGYCYRRFIVTSDDAPDPESGRLIENPRGNWVHIEYPAKGLVLSPDSDGRIRAFSFQKDRP